VIPDFVYREGDQGPTFEQKLAYSDGTAPNFTNATLGLMLRSLASTEPLTLHAPVQVKAGATDTLQWTPDATDTAAIAPGDYLGYWTAVIGGVPVTFPTQGNLWVRVEPNLTSVELKLGSRPLTRQVGALLRARTRDKGGSELGDFVDGQTRPGATEVDGLIDEALAEVLGKVVGVDSTLAPGSAYNAPGSDYEGRVRSAVALYAAVLVESSYQPESAAQRGAGSSVAALYLQMYRSRIDSLIVEDKMGKPEGLGDTGTGGSGGGADGPADAAWAFPTSLGGMVGMNSRW
jgi:hypothetical protein